MNNQKANTKYSFIRSKYFKEMALDFTLSTIVI